MTTSILASQPRGGFLVGLIGSGIGGSFSPQLHETEAREQGFELHYRLIDAQQRGFSATDLPRLLDAMALVGFQGSNVTHPFKEAVLPSLGSLSDAAAAIGAVNTIVHDPARGWVGHNTDWLGFVENFRRFLPGAAIDRVMLLGAGGAGAAIGYGMLRHGVGELIVCDSDKNKSSALRNKLADLFGSARVRRIDAPREAMDRVDGVINATPIGMHGKPGTPFDVALLEPRLWVADIIYFPLQTALLQAATACGCRILGGGGMVVFQAAEAFRLFTGVTADAERMLRHFHRCVGE